MGSLRWVAGRFFTDLLPCFQRFCFICDHAARKPIVFPVASMRKYVKMFKPSPAWWHAHRRRCGVVRCHCASLGASKWRMLSNSAPRPTGACAAGQTKPGEHPALIPHTFDQFKCTHNGASIKGEGRQRS